MAGEDQRSFGTKGQRIRNPYQGEIIRNLPKEIFAALQRGICHSRMEEIVNNFSLAENRNVMQYLSRRGKLLFHYSLYCLECHKG